MRAPLVVLVMLALVPTAAAFPPFVMSVSSYVTTYTAAAGSCRGYDDITVSYESLLQSADVTSTGGDCPFVSLSFPPTSCAGTLAARVTCSVGTGIALAGLDLVETTPGGPAHFRARLSNADGSFNEIATGETP